MFKSTPAQNNGKHISLHTERWVRWLASMLKKNKLIGLTEVFVFCCFFFFTSEMPNESDIYVSLSVLYERALGFLIYRNKLWCVQWCQSKLFLFIFKAFNGKVIHNSLSFARFSNVCISKLGVYIFKKISNSKGVHFKHHSGQRKHEGFAICFLYAHMR